MTREPRFAIKPPAPRIPLSVLQEWSIEDYAEQLRGSAMKRATLAMLKRNADIVNQHMHHARADSRATRKNAKLHES